MMNSFDSTNPELLDSILENIPGPFCALDTNGCYLAFNKAHALYMLRQYEAEIGYGKRMIDCVTSDKEKEFLLDKFEEVLGGQKFVIERAEPGTAERYSKITFSPVYDSENQITGLNITSKDLTERKLSEINQWKNNRKFGALLRRAPVCYQSIDIEGRLIDVNQQWLTMAGYERDEVIGRNFGDFVAPEQLVFLRRQFGLFKEQGKTQYEIDIIHKNGHPVTVMIEGNINYDTKGNFICTHCLLLDVTDRKIAIDKIRKSENLFSRAFRNSPVAMVIIRQSDDTIVDANDSFVKMVECTYEELTGKNAISLNLVSQTLLEKLKEKIIKEGGITNTEIELHTKAGHTLHLIASTEFSELAGEVCTLVTLLDISTIRYAEQELKNNASIHQTIIHTSIDGFWIIDRHGRILEVNESYSAMSGYTIGELLNMSVSDLSINQGQAQIESRIKDIVSSEGFKRFETVHRRKDGTLFDVEVSIQAIESTGNAVVFMRDITEKKRAEDTLRKSEEKFKKAFMTIPDCFNINRMEDGMYIEFNPAFTEIMGYTGDEILGETSIGKNIWYDPEERKKWVAELLKNGEVKNYVTRFVRKDGVAIDAMVSATILELNGVKHVMSITRDITDRIQAENALRESRARLDAALSSMTDAVFISDKKGNFVELNNAFATYHRYNSLAECSRSFADCPDNLEVFEASGKPISDDSWAVPRALRGESESNGEYMLRRKDTGEEWIGSYSFGPIRDNHGEITGSVVVARDVTEQRMAERKLAESEQKISTLFSNMSEVVAIHELVFDKEGKAIDYRIVDCNKAFEKITGVKKEDATGRLASEVYGTGSAPFLEIYAKVATTGEPYEFNTYFAPLDKHLLISVVSPEKNHFATISNDVTDILHIQELITDKNKELENYLYVASHDLRSPLVNIQGFSQRLQKQSEDIRALVSGIITDKEIKEKLDRITGEGMPRTLDFIMTNVAKMDLLIKNLLQLSRTGQLQMNIKKQDMNQLFKKILASYNFQLTELSVSVRTENLEDCYGDENQLNQLFSNIIDNAIKYRDKSRPLEIEIKSKGEFNRVVYSISDTGRGIEERHLAKIWDIFYRVDSREPDSGDGIGLSLSRGIVNKHKGRIWVESEHGKGSTFYVELQKKEFTE